MRDVPICPGCGFNLEADRTIARDGWVLTPTICYFNEGEFTLSGQRAALLYALARAWPRVIHREVLAARILEEGGSAKVMHIVVCQVRKKMLEAGVPDPIQTMTGSGYRWWLPSAAKA